jgi:hypothetical protein
MKITFPKPLYVFIFVILFEFVVVSYAIYSGNLEGDIKINFKENSFTTVFSFNQLLFLCIFSYIIYFVRSQMTNTQKYFGSHIIWLIIGCGFLYLAFDERFQFHERFDGFLHDAFLFDETPLSDRIDDIILLLYGLFGLVLIYSFRREFLQFGGINWFFIIGIGLFFLMSAFDIISNRFDVIQIIIKDLKLAETIQKSVQVSEDSIKLIAEGFFFVALYYHLYKSKS